MGARRALSDGATCEVLSSLWYLAASTGVWYGTNLVASGDTGRNHGRAGRVSDAVQYMTKGLIRLVEGDGALTCVKVQCLPQFCSNMGWAVVSGTSSMRLPAALCYATVAAPAPWPDSPSSRAHKQDARQVPPCPPCPLTRSCPISYLTVIESCQWEESRYCPGSLVTASDIMALPQKGFDDEEGLPSYPSPQVLPFLSSPISQYLGSITSTTGSSSASVKYY